MFEYIYVYIYIYPNFLKQTLLDIGPGIVIVYNFNTHSLQELDIPDKNVNKFHSQFLPRIKWI
jgi:hypothetical protein